MNDTLENRVIALSDNYAVQEAAEPAPQAQETAAPQVEQPAEQLQEQPQEQPQESFQARNFKELKKAAERERKEKEELARQLEEYKRHIEQMQSSPATASVQDSSDDIEIGADDFAEGRHIQKISKRQQIIAQENKRLQQEVYQMRVERELEKEIPDFYKVVTDENVKAFAMMDPMHAKVLASHPDLKERAQAVYSAIVKSGIHKMDDAQPDYSVQKELVKQNLAKPKTGAAIAQSPMERSLDNYDGQLTDEIKRKFYAEMKRAQQGR